MVLLSSWVEVAQLGNIIILQEDQENPGPDLWGKVADLSGTGDGP